MKFEPMNPQPPVTKTFTPGLRRAFLGKRKTQNGKRLGHALASRFPFPVSRPVSYDADLGVVADQESVDAGTLQARMNTDVGADQGIRNAHGDPLQARALQHDRVLDLAALDETVRPDRRVGADEGVPDLGAWPDDGGPAHGRADETGSRLDDDLPFHAASRVQLVEALRRKRVEDDAVGFEHVLDLSGVLPPTRDDVRVNALAVIHEPLDGVGDLQLLPRARSDLARGLEDRVVKH